MNPHHSVPPSVSDPSPRLQEWDYYDVLADDGSYLAVRIRLIGGNESDDAHQMDSIYLKVCGAVDRELARRRVNQRVIVKIGDAIKVSNNGDYIFVGGTISGVKDAVEWAIEAMRASVSADACSMRAYAKRTPHRVENWEPIPEREIKERKHITVPRVSDSGSKKPYHYHKRPSVHDIVSGVYVHVDPVLKTEIVDGDESHMD